MSGLVGRHVEWVCGLGAVCACVCVCGTTEPSELLELLPERLTTLS